MLARRSDSLIHIGKGEQVVPEEMLIWAGGWRGSHFTMWWVAVEENRF